MLWNHSNEYAVRLRGVLGERVPLGLRFGKTNTVGSLRLEDESLGATVSRNVRNMAADGQGLRVARNVVYGRWCDAMSSQLIHGSTYESFMLL